MFLNIVTACKRPKNLHAISKNIQSIIPRDSYRWIVVFDSERGKIPNNYIPDNCEHHYHPCEISVGGYAQKNKAFDLIQDGHVYQLDDDTVILKELWNEVQNKQEEFIHFKQYQSNRNKLNHVNGEIKVGKIDTGCFIFHANILKKGLRYTKINDPFSDSYFAILAEKICHTKLFINKPLSIYNALRPNESNWRINGPKLKKLEL
jgi:hypothetical protein